MKPFMVLKDYILFNIIGKGSFGEVYLTQKKNTDEYLATKRLDLKQLNPIIQKYLNNEISIMRQLNHPNIIRLVDLYKTTNHYYVIMEYCNGGALSQSLQKYGKPFPVEIVQYFMRQIVNGLKYIHFNRIIHRDLKLDNILLNYKNIEDKNNFNLLASEVKIIDFGLATKLQPNTLANTAAGSPINMDPCILKKYNKAGGYDKLQGYNEKADIWSLGTICYEMLTGKSLFNVNNLEELKEKVEIGDYNLPTNINLTKELISFINGMLQYNGDLRLSADELSRHDFLVKNINDFTPANLDGISYKLNGINLIINSKKNQTISEMFNIKRNGNPEWDNYIIGLLNEYKCAKEYFKENNLKKQELNTNNLYLKIQNIKTQYDLGNLAYMNSLPEPITPEFIYGYSKEERDKKYNEVLSKYVDDKNKLETKINSYNKDALKFNNELKLEYEKDLSDLELYKNNIKELECNLNNVWVPTPEYIQECKTVNEEKIYNCNLLKLEIKKVDNKKENLNLLITLKYNEINVFNKEVKLHNENNYHEKWTWTINAKDWLNMDNFFLKIENDKNTSINKKPIKIKVNIGKVKNGKGITFNSLISEENKEMINITIIPVLLEGKKYVCNVKKDVVNIKIYPAFEGKSPATKNIPNFEKNNQ